MDHRIMAEARERLAEEFEIMLSSMAYEDITDVAWALVDVIESAAVGPVVARVIQKGSDAIED